MGKGVGLCNVSLPASDRTDFSQTYQISDCFSNHNESLIRHECSATYQNWRQKNKPHSRV